MGCFHADPDHLLVHGIDLAALGGSKLQFGGRFAPTKLALCYAVAVPGVAVHARTLTVRLDGSSGALACGRYPLGRRVKLKPFGQR